jgi:uncharacterized protein YegP (UPF0339 family)
MNYQVTYNFEEAKENVIELIKRNTHDFRSDMLKEIKTAAEYGSFDDVEIFVNEVHTAEKVCERQIDTVKKATSIAEILNITSDYNALGNILFEQDDTVLSAILGIQVKQNWNCIK